MEGAARQSAEGQHEREQPYVAREPRPPVQAFVLARDEVGEPATESARGLCGWRRRGEFSSSLCGVLSACCGACYRHAVACHRHATVVLSPCC